jgi:multidrug resistance efflux pump
MFVPFSRTLRSLNTERSGLRVLCVLSIAGVLGLWAAWLVFGRIALYEVSPARIEVEQAVRPIQSLYTGRISINRMVVGQPVRQGDVLVEFEAEVQKLQLVEEQRKREPLRLESEVLLKEIGAEEQAMEEEQKGGEIGAQEALARLREAEAAANYAALEEERKSKLGEAGILSSLDLERAKSETVQRRAVAESLRLTFERQQREQQTHKNDRRSRIEALRRELNQLAGQKDRLAVVVDRLQSEMGLRRIIAPIDGTIGEAADLKPGTVVNAGERLGMIVPFGRLRIVAPFSPAKALGRVQHGQHARLKLDGFPWTQYGTVEATVTRVANEVRDGNLRVELSPGPTDRIQLQHGLPGTIEVQVEKISPAALLLRVAGRMLAPAQEAGSKTAKIAGGIQ